ncbi:hypothetical protein FRZ67_10325 [Panacibacter ginsenosidivorans]|uniref:Uncharacterized protein n=1 Tax=Panacibacter ginsenosidivorans TaxID=1813871 RepID=A0A5B8VBJ2_9BACT|nr:hypothetical protein [Panacibacter ginsenosidivorans]QEC67668.1 hypothetical protein FRZ67_10325 [Panacibacter ginsenosidivorans]
MRKTYLLRVAYFCFFAATLTFITSCQSFYKVSKTPVATAHTDSLVTANPQRYFVLRSGTSPGKAYHMSNMVVSPDKRSITCMLDSLEPEHQLHLKNGRGGNMRYKINKPEKAVLDEIHLYIANDDAIVAGSNYTLALDKVQKIEVLEKNKGKTTTSWVLGSIGYTVGAIVVVAVIIAATKSSCPFVSAYDGNEMSLQGEIYGGAIYPQLCRNDFIKLKMAPAKTNTLQLQISNELKEKQFTDLAELMVVTHDKDVTVMTDEQGNLYSISNPQIPVAATASGRDVLPLLLYQKDDQTYNFNDTALNNGSNNLQLTFTKPSSAANAKLVLRLKNSYWLDLAYGKMTEGFGSYYPSFIKQQYKKPVEDLKRWTNAQQIPLSISVQTPQGWQKQQQLTTFGPVATREIVVPIDLTGINSKTVTLELSSGFMFWEIDYAAVDFSAETPLLVTRLLPIKATDETGSNVMPALEKEDNAFLEQPVPGNAAIIEYAYTPLKDTAKTQTFILHAKGYYEHVRDYKNKPDIAFLEQFKKPGALSTYSLNLYKEAMQADLQAMANK